MVLVERRQPIADSLDGLVLFLVILFWLATRLIFILSSFLFYLAPKSHQRMPCLPPQRSRLFPVPAAYFGDRHGKTHSVFQEVVSSEVTFFNNVTSYSRNSSTSAAIAVTFTSRGFIHSRRSLGWVCKAWRTIHVRPGHQVTRQEGSIWMVNW